MAEIEKQKELDHAEMDGNAYTTSVEAKTQPTKTVDGQTDCCVKVNVEDPELKAIKALVRDLKKTAEKLKKVQYEIDKEFNFSLTLPESLSEAETLDSDSRSIYVGNVDYGATAEELESYFMDCGDIYRVTILCDDITGHPKGFAYIEFAYKNSVAIAQSLNGSVFKGRKLKVDPKRTNKPDFKAAKQREIEETDTLKTIHSEVDKQFKLRPFRLATPTRLSIEKKTDVDDKSIYVGNVDYGATASELEAHFHGCGAISRVTIPCNPLTGHPRGFAYIEFADKDSVVISLALDGSFFRDRQIKIVRKRTTRPGFKTYCAPRGRGSKYRRNMYYQPY